MVAVREALLHLKVSGQNLWLPVLLFLSAWSLTGHAQPFTLPEVVTPLRVSGSSRGMISPGWLSYSLNFGGQRHIIHLKANRMLVSRHLPVFTYTDQGALHEDQPFVQKDCYFHGFVEGDPESMVAITTCLGGFRGTLQINNTVYEIKPKSLSSTFEHLVSKVDSEETEVPPLRCGLTEEEIARQMKLRERDKSTLMQSSYEGWWTHRWYIELLAVIDHHLFLNRNSNVSSITNDIFIIVHEINSIILSLDVSITLLGIEIWNKGNPMPTNDMEDLLGDFCYWKATNTNFSLKHDVTLLFIHKEFGIFLGVAYISGICVKNFNCGVVTSVRKDLFSIGLTTAHEIGHILGMQHDNNLCTCGPGKCVMAPNANNSKKFSNCSYSYLVNTTISKSCIRNAPNKLEVLPWNFCGNGVVEDGEECDCGSLMRCEFDPCCRKGCLLKYGADCALGLCCKNCLFKPRGMVCREKDNECDLPEWCNGTSHLCPEDVYVQDGSPCGDGGHCHGKRCNQRDEQCRQIFGKEAKSANHSCYREMNTRGDRFGNCGVTEDAYIRCNISDILCGRVQCENVIKIPLLQGHSTVHWSHFNSVTCWGTDYHWGMTIPDLGDVKDGTLCGPELVCMNRKCVDKSIWRSDCSLKTCNMKGVCNNKHHCHCDFGWGPPHCLVNGSGGSVDSGPAPTGSVEEKLTRNPNFYRTYFFMPFFVMLLCLICLWMQNKLSPEKQEPNVPTLPDE